MLKLKLIALKLKVKTLLCTPHLVGYLEHLGEVSDSQMGTIIKAQKTKVNIMIESWEETRKLFQGRRVQQRKLRAYLRISRLGQFPTMSIPERKRS